MIADSQARIHAGTNSPAVTPVLRTISQVASRPVNWLWPGRIPRGAITVIDSDPGLGKSTITGGDLAARLSRGWEMPPAAGPCQGAEAEDVLLLNAEDDVETTIRPRLEAAGADIDKVHVLEGVMIGKHVRPVALPHDIEIIEQIIRQHTVGMVVVDPLMAYLDRELDAHKDQDVRLVLYHLNKMAADTGAAVVLVRHLNKHGNGTAIYRGGGSIGIIGAARSGLILSRHPEKPDVCVLAVSKANLARKPMPLEYSIAAAGEVSKVAWGDVINITADELLSPRRADKSPEAVSRKRNAKEHEHTSKFLAALDVLDPDQTGTSYKKVRLKSGLNSDNAERAYLNLSEVLEEIPSFTVEAGNGAKKKCRGIRRRKNDDLQA